IGKLVKAAREGKKMELIVEPKVRNALVALARQHLQHGGRGIRNALDSALVNPLSRVLFDRNVQPHALVRVQDLIDRGEEAATRFDLTVEVQSGATSLPGGNH
ncbi:MAG TPA: hypothetical protein PLI07_08515, partial [Candidatus Hydrogenedentes bacterium]|nr:hypothetical protein [Candidatus Hydrogenedentota bacterium]